jgi:hypothetical protein
MFGPHVLACSSAEMKALPARISTNRPAYSLTVHSTLSTIATQPFPLFGRNKIAESVLAHTALKARQFARILGQLCAFSACRSPISITSWSNCSIALRGPSGLLAHSASRGAQPCGHSAGRAYKPARRLSNGNAEWSSPECDYSTINLPQRPTGARRTRGWTRRFAGPQAAARGPPSRRLARMSPRASLPAGKGVLTFTTNRW